MIKLYNNSHFEDATLKTILTCAAKAVRCRIARGVVVKVTRGGRSWRLASTATGCRSVRRYLLVRNGGKRWIETDGGFVVIRPQHRRLEDDFLRVASRFYRTCCHELGHVRDWQRKGPFDHKRMPWESRIQEIRAEEYADIAMGILNDQEAPPEPEDALLELATQWEAYYIRRGWHRFQTTKREA